MSSISQAAFSSNLTLTVQVERPRRSNPAYLGRVLRFAVLRWSRAKTLDYSARWFAAVDRIQRLNRLATAPFTVR